MDPIRGVLKLTLETGVELEVGQEELTAEPLKEEVRKTKKNRGNKERGRQRKDNSGDRVHCIQSKSNQFNQLN